MDGISLIREKAALCFHDGNYRDERGICAEGISTGLVIWTGCFVVTVLLALTGTIEPLMLVHNKAGLGYVDTKFLGYTHPNVLHISYVIFTRILVLYVSVDRGKSC